MPSRDHLPSEGQHPKNTAKRTAALMGYAGYYSTKYLIEDPFDLTELFVNYLPVRFFILLSGRERLFRQVIEIVFFGHVLLVRRPYNAFKFVVNKKVVAVVREALQVTLWDVMLFLYL